MDRLAVQKPSPSVVRAGAGDRREQSLSRFLRSWANQQANQRRSRLPRVVQFRPQPAGLVADCQASGSHGREWCVQAWPGPQSSAHGGFDRQFPRGKPEANDRTFVSAVADQPTAALGNVVVCRIPHRAPGACRGQTRAPWIQGDERLQNGETGSSRVRSNRSAMVISRASPW